MDSIYDRALNGYDRERCDDCRQWMPWPALDDHDCRDDDQR